MADTNTTQQPFSDSLLNRFFLSPQEKQNKDKGKGIVKQFYTQQSLRINSTKDFTGRNAIWEQLLLWAKGSQNMTEFLDFMSVSDANKSYVKIDTEPQRIAAQFVGTLVESMAKNRNYSCVNAIDDGSMTEKENRMFEAIFRMNEAQTINQIQQEAGVQLEPTNAYVPDDELSAKIYFALEDRLPKEMRFEKIIELLKQAISHERILNRKTLYDLTVLNIVAGRIEKCPETKYTVRKCNPINTVYNFFRNDSGEMEVDMIGEFDKVKVKDLREKFGKSISKPDGLTEEEIYELAKGSSTQNKVAFNHVWQNEWATMTNNLPYDDYNVAVFNCSINCGNDIYYVSKKDNFGKENITEKKGIPYNNKQVKPDDVDIIKRQRKQWMRGVYAPYGDKMLYWGDDDLIINEYTNTSNPLCPYTIIIPNNDGGYVPSLFQRALEPLKEYSICKLKRKQLIAALRPHGIRIDVESARNLDLGNGDSIAWEEVVRIFNQTGNELWSSKGINPLENSAPPISNTAANTAMQDIVGLTNTMMGIVSEIRQLLGVPQYRDGSDVGDRTSGVLQAQQNSASYNVTDYVLNANSQFWELMDYKICLLHWNDIVKNEPESKSDMLNTRFQITVKTKSSDYENELIEKDIDRYSQVIDASGNPAISPKDAMYLREIDNYKEARWYMANAIEQNRRKSIQDSQRQQADNAKIQQQSAQMASEQAAQAQDAKIIADKDLAEYAALQQMKIKIVEGSFQIAAKGAEAQMPAWLAPIIMQLVPNIQIPIQQENEQTQKEIEAQQQAEAQQAQEQQMAKQQEMEQPQM